MQANNHAVSGGLFMNPLIKKLDKVKEQSSVHATYGGIFRRCLFFVVMILAGVVLANVLNGMFPITVDATGELNLPQIHIILAMTSLAVMLVFPFLAFFLRKTIPVTGALYCMFVGYALTFVALMDTELAAILMLALALTLAIVIIMAALFVKGVIKVTAKFRAVTTVLFSTMVLGGCAVFLLSLIPGLGQAMLFLQENLLLAVLFSVLGIVVATLFLLVDFEQIRQAVENRLPKQYEWYAAFSLAFTVIWLYFKILDLLTRLKDGK